MTPDLDRREVGGLRIEIDRGLCVGFADCVGVAPDLFQLDREGLAAFRHPARADAPTILSACDACPVDALTVWDREGRQLIP